MTPDAAKANDLAVYKNIIDDNYDIYDIYELSGQRGPTTPLNLNQTTRHNLSSPQPRREEKL